MLNTLTKENFNASLNSFSTAELENMVERFPYFQQAHLLLAKKYQEENNYKFDQQLQLAALYTQDRELFHEIFNQSISAIVQPSIEEREVLTVTHQPPFTEPFKETVEEVVVKPNAEEEIFVAPVLIGDTTSVETIAEETIAKPEQELISAQPQAEEVIKTQTVEVVEQLIEKPFNMAEPHTFDEWLKAFAQPDTIKTEVPAEVSAAEQEKLDEELEKLYLTNMPLDLKELVEEETQYSKGLDRFIEEQIEKTKTRPTAKAIETNSAFVTETMARVYEQQKKYAKAIECYGKLSLSHPEKNDFFAARINYLKTLL